MLGVYYSLPLQLMLSTFDSDDIKLIEKFVQGSNQLLASDRVRMETTGTISQIVTKAGDVAAIMYLRSQPRTALVKVNSAYAEQLEGHLQEHNFVLMGDSKRAGYSEYHQYIIPAGYKIKYTDPALLWKKWWPTERFQNKQRFNMNILVRMKDNWYPVQNIVIDAGVFIIKTLVGQFSVGSSEQLLWLAQVPPEGKVLDPTDPDAWSRSPAMLKNAEQEQVNVASKSVPSPPTWPEQVQELERKLYKQQKATIAAEQRAMMAERRATAAEQQLALLPDQPQKKGLEANWLH
jgi:hypothetical protein